MPYLERLGEPTIYYELDDYTDPWKQAPVLLLQHGFGRSSRVWYGWVLCLSRFYKVVRPDLRGLGRSSHDFGVRSAIRAPLAAAGPRRHRSPLSPRLTWAAPTMNSPLHTPG